MLQYYYDFLSSLIMHFFCSKFSNFLNQLLFVLFSPFCVEFFVYERASIDIIEYSYIASVLTNKIFAVVYKNLAKLNIDFVEAIFFYMFNKSCSFFVSKKKLRYLLFCLLKFFKIDFYFFFLKMKCCTIIKILNK